MCVTLLGFVLSDGDGVGRTQLLRKVFGTLPGKPETWRVDETSRPCLLL